MVNFARFHKTLEIFKKELEHSYRNKARSRMDESFQRQWNFFQQLASTERKPAASCGSAIEHESRRCHVLEVRLDVPTWRKR